MPPYTGGPTSSFATTITSLGLCAGFNFATPTSSSIVSSTTYYVQPTASGGTPAVFNPGAYAYNKIQYGAFTYEIECNIGWSGATTVSPATTFEGCINACNIANAGSLGACIAAVFQATSQTCYLSSDTTGHISFNPLQKLARLIYSSYPLVTDAIYLQPTTSNLGLCTSNAAYAMQVIFPQYTDGNYLNGGSKYYYENECGAYYSPNLITGGTIPFSSLPPALQNPGSAEDCMRSCNYVNRNFQTGGSVSFTVNCNIYIWSVSGQSCVLYTVATTTRILDNDKYSGKYIIGYSPVQAGIVDRPAGYGYKARRVLAGSGGAIPFPTPAPDFDPHALISDRPANFGNGTKDKVIKYRD